MGGLAVGGGRCDAPIYKYTKMPSFIFSSSIRNVIYNIYAFSHAQCRLIILFQRCVYWMFGDGDGSGGGGLWVSTPTR